MANVFISAFASSAYKIFGLLYYMSFVIAFRALISWVSPDPRNIIVQLVYTITEPVLEPLRRIIPPIGIIDFSALIAMIGFYFGGMILKYVYGISLFRSNCIMYFTFRLIIRRY